MNKLYVLCPLKEYAFKSTKIAKPSIQAIWERKRDRQTDRERERERERERQRERERDTRRDSDLLYCMPTDRNIFSANYNIQPVITCMHKWAGESWVLTTKAGTCINMLAI